MGGGGGGILEVDYEEKVSGINSRMENLVLAYRHGCSKRLVRFKQERARQAVDTQTDSEGS